MTEPRIREKSIWANEFVFAAAMWLASRLIIAIAMFIVAPSLPAPPRGIKTIVGYQVLSWWDSLLYQQIATSGYEYVNDGQEHSLAFFPLFPIVIRGVMLIGCKPEVAGALVNNLAFFGALVVLYRWVEERHGLSAAQWATAVLALCPLSLFGTVVYSEGLYLLLSTAALRAFDQQRYLWASLWGAMATATRPTGIALIPTFLIAAWRKRAGAISYAAGLLTSVGLLSFSLYCQVRFGDFLAFLHAQRSWRPSLGFDWQGWWGIFLKLLTGTKDWHNVWTKDPLYPILFLFIIGTGYLLWRYRKSRFGHPGSITFICSFTCLGLFLWLLAGDPLIQIVMLFGGGYLLWCFRAKLSQVAVIYGFCALGLILSAGSPISVNRLAYGIVSLEIALGLLLARYPRWGYAVMGYFALVLGCYAIRFAEHRWIA